MYKLIKNIVNKYKQLKKEMVEAYNDMPNFFQDFIIGCILTFVFIILYSIFCIILCRS